MPSFSHVVNEHIAIVNYLRGRGPILNEAISMTYDFYMKMGLQITNRDRAISMKNIVQIEELLLF